MTGDVVSEASVIAIASRNDNRVSCRMQVANKVCRQWKHCRESVNKPTIEKTNPLRFVFLEVGADDRRRSERSERNSDCFEKRQSRQLQNAGCKQSLPTMETLSRIRQQANDWKNEPVKVRFFRSWCGWQESNLHTLVQEPKSCVSANSTTSAFGSTFIIP